MPFLYVIIRKKVIFMENKFSEEDKKKVIEFLNIIAEKATFSLDTAGVIKYYGLLSYFQKELIPKIDSNILEIVQLIEEKKESRPAKKTTSKGKK